MSFEFPKSLNNDQCKQILEIWNDNFPANISKGKASFGEYLDKLNDQQHIVLIGKEGEIAAWLCLFNRDNERWFVMIIHQSIQGKGHGTTMLNLAKDFEKELSGWVIDHNEYKKLDGETYRSPLAFYLKNNFRIIANSRLEGEDITAIKIQRSDRFSL